MENLKDIIRRVVLVGILLLLWDTILLQPLRFFVENIHKGGHIVMGIIFGYSIETLSFGSEGIVFSRSDNIVANIFIYNAGYLACIFYAWVIFVLKTTKWKQYILEFVGIFYISIAIKLTGYSYELIGPIAFAIGILIINMLKNEQINAFFIEIIEISCFLGVVYDIIFNNLFDKIDVGFAKGLQASFTRQCKDIPNLASVTGLPKSLWTFVWLVAIAFFTYYFNIKSIFEKKNDS